MLSVLFDILSYFVMVVFIIAFVGTLLFFMRETNKRVSIKWFICFSLCITLSYIVLTQLVIQITLVANLLSTVENIEPWVKEVIYLTIQTFYVIFYIVGCFVIAYLNRHQIIPGKGNIRRRLKHHYKKLREEAKERRRDVSEHRRERRAKKDKKEI